MINQLLLIMVPYSWNHHNILMTKTIISWRSDSDSVGNEDTSDDQAEEHYPDDITKSY